jgi:hypothetical protein
LGPSIRRQSSLSLRLEEARSRRGREE